jgi:steroid delta-isomerase-like uncharacterized protein
MRVAANLEAVFMRVVFIMVYNRERNPVDVEASLRFPAGKRKSLGFVQWHCEYLSQWTVLSSRSSLARSYSPNQLAKESPMATAEENRRTMQRFVVFINTADENLAAELVSPKATFHVPGRTEPVSGPPGYLEIIQMMRSGFPDIQWTLEEVIAEGDKVAARFTMRGTHQGTFFGVPPTGKKITVQALNIYRFADGQIVEERGQPDLLELLKQIGAIPAR